MSNPKLDERILVLTPTGRDGALAAQNLSAGGLLTVACANLAAFTAKIEEGGAAGIIAEEAITTPGLAALEDFVRRQPPWSDFPIILIAAGEQSATQSAARYRHFQKLGNLTILERPFHRETLLTAAQSALRNRQRQYEGRAHLLERTKIADELERRVIERTKALTETQQALQDAQRLEAIGRLAGGVAHDFNNLMTGIQGIAEDMASDLDKSDPKRPDLEEIVKAAARASALTKQLLAFGRKQVISPTALNVNEIIKGMYPLFMRLLREDIQLRLDLAEGAGKIWMDHSNFEQVLINVVMNARDAMPHGGVITIKTAALEAPPQVLLSVTDSGTGISKESMAHIFEPFFTTKGVGGGTGLGLATVYGNVKQSGGDIAVASELGRGTTITVVWPRSDAPQENMKAPVLSSVRGKETILIVEDEDIVRRVAYTALLRQGYQVLQAQNGAEALKIYAKNANAISLLLIDVVMPGMDGRQTAETILMEGKRVAVLYMSGHTADIIAHKGVLEKNIAFIEKPFTARSLGEKVREVLDTFIRPPADRGLL